MRNGPTRALSSGVEKNKTKTVLEAVFIYFYFNRFQIYTSELLISKIRTQAFIVIFLLQQKSDREPDYSRSKNYYSQCYCRKIVGQIALRYD